MDSKNMATDKHPIPSYLDKEEFEKLQEIAKKWGVSYSGVIKRLIREKKL